MDEIKTMTLEEIEERRKALAEEIGGADMERLTAINAELDAIEERKREIKTQAEERAKAVQEVLEMPAADPIIEKREEKKMTDREYRNTPEYIDAYVAYLKTGDPAEFEKRMPAPAGSSVVMSENAIGGNIAVPTYVEDKINATWENNELLRRVRRMAVKGNVKIGVETSATGAVIHSEGGDAITPEELVITYVNLVPEYVKKLVKVTHTVLELTGTSFIDFLYDEIEYELAKKICEEIENKLDVSGLVNTSYAAGESLTTADIIAAEGELEGDANPVLITSRTNAAALKAAALGANYGYDPFDGLDVIYMNGFGSGAGLTLGYLVDPSAIVVNFPDGGEPKFIFDEFTEADANIVRIVGRLAMACAVVAQGKCVKIIGSEE